MNGFLISLAAGFIPMILFAWFLFYLDRYEKEPLKLLAGMFLWGALIAASGSFVINSLSSLGILFITQSDLATQLVTSTLIAPVVEETLKGAAILIVFLLFKPEFDSLLDGIIYGGIAALGFAAVENAWYIYQFGFLSNGYQGILEITLIRVILVGWQHPFYTAFTGLGFALADHTKHAPLRVVYPFLGWAIGAGLHLLHNLFAMLASNLGHGKYLSLIWDWTGYLGLLILILLLIKREQNWMRTYLAPEKESGLIDSQKYHIASSAWRQSQAYFQSLKKGNGRLVRQYFQTCGNLMQELRQIDRHGLTAESHQEIEHLRAELALLGKAF